MRTLYILENLRVKFTEIAHSMGISADTVKTILHTKLGMLKVSSRWVPRMLTPQMKHRKMDACRELLDWYTTDPDHFFSRIVTGDETWLYHRDPENKQKSIQWKHTTSLSPETFRTQSPVGKEVVATIFRDMEQCCNV